MKRKLLDLSIIAFSVAGIVALCNKYKTGRQQETKDKYFLYYDVLNKWMKQKERGNSVANILRKQGIREVAIYGMGDIGQHLQHELADTGIVVKYAIDRSFFTVSDLDVYSPDSALPQVDAVIVTPVFDYEGIRECLEQKLSCPILSIADVFDGNGKAVYEN